MPALRLSILLPVLLLGGFAVLSVQAQTPPWGDLSSWVGQYPTTRTGGKVNRLLEQSAIRSELRKILSPADQRLLGAYEIETPIENRDGFIVIAKCRPRNCGDEQATVVLDSKVPRLWVRFFERRPGGVSTRWYGNADDYTVLPASILQASR
jgi:hypothetical protein